MHVIVGDECIPKVTEIKDISHWLSKDGVEHIAKDFDSVPSRIKRLVQDGYICFYCRQESS